MRILGLAAFDEESSWEIRGLDPKAIGLVPRSSSVRAELQALSQLEYQEEIPSADGKSPCHHSHPQMNW